MAAPSPASISPTFHATAQLAAADNLPPDTLLQSTDGARFYVRAAVLTLASSNGFGGLLPAAGAPGSPLPVREGPGELDLILRTAYHLPAGAAPQAVSWTSLARAAASLKDRFAIALPGPGSALFAGLMAHAGRADGAADLYALAGQLGYHALAVAASEHLLALSLPDASTEWVVQVGAVYLRRLYMLHIERTAAFKRIVAARPALHAPAPGCGAREMQEHVLGPWAYAVAQLIFEAGCVAAPFAGMALTPPPGRRVQPGRAHSDYRGGVRPKAPTYYINYPFNGIKLHYPLPLKYWDS